RSRAARQQARRRALRRWLGRLDDLPGAGARHDETLVVCRAAGATERFVRDAALPVVITGSADHSCQGGQKSVRQLGERRRAHVLAGTRHRSPLSKTFRSHDYATSPAPQKAVAQVTSFAPVRPATQTGMV